MSDAYQLRLSPRALERLAEVPAALRPVVEDALDRLAASPTTWSERSTFPFRPDRQVYHFTAADPEDREWKFVALFQFTQDERSLYLTSFSAHEPRE